MKNNSEISARAFVFSVVAAIGGILFGYNTSVISGVLLFVDRDFHLTTVQQEFIVSTLLIGALIGSLLGGVIADRFGRIKTLFFTLFLFTIGVLILAYAAGFESLLIGRFISGLAVGIVSMAAPLYIAEISPPSKRGAFVSLNQLCITIGILLAYVISYIYSREAGWREMFGFALFPIAVQFIGLFFLRESPSWLENQKLSQVESSKQSYRELFSSSVRKPFLIGIGIAVFQAITGINTVIYYAPQIFQTAGYKTDQSALLATVFIGVINVLATLVALRLIDRIGRRPLLITGLLGMAGCLALLALAFLFEGRFTGWGALVGLILYVAFFAISLGPVAWLIISEVYPQGIRGRAMGIATFSNWVSNYFVSLSFLTMIQDFGSSGTFLLYAIICFLALWFVIKLVPETKGKTFDEIQRFWDK